MNDGALTIKHDKIVLCELLFGETNEENIIEYINDFYYDLRHYLLPGSLLTVELSFDVVERSISFTCGDSYLPEVFSDFKDSIISLLILCLNDLTLSRIC